MTAEISDWKLQCSNVVSIYSTYIISDSKSWYAEFIASLKFPKCSMPLHTYIYSMLYPCCILCLFKKLLRAPPWRFSQCDGGMARPGTISGFRMARPLWTWRMARWNALQRSTRQVDSQAGLTDMFHFFPEVDLSANMVAQNLMMNPVNGQPSCSQGCFQTD